MTFNTNDNMRDDGDYSFGQELFRDDPEENMRIVKFINGMIAIFDEPSAIEKYGFQRENINIVMDKILKDKRIQEKLNEITNFMINTLNLFNRQD